MSRVGLRQCTRTLHALWLGMFVFLMSVFFARDALSGLVALAGTTYSIALSMYTGGKADEWIARENDARTIAEQIKADKPRDDA